MNISTPSSCLIDIQTLSQPGGIVNHLYFTNNTFCDDGSLVVASDHQGPVRLYRVKDDRWTQIATCESETRMHCTCFRHSVLLANDLGRVFWIDGQTIHDADIFDGADHQSVMMPVYGKCQLEGPLSRYPGSDWVLFYKASLEQTIFGRLHVHTREIEWGPTVPFLANHIQASDIDGNAFCFARESILDQGIWYHNAHRVWHGNFETKTVSVHYQHQQIDEQNFEHIGHEMFCPANKNVIAARYRSTPVGLPGIVRLQPNQCDMIWQGPAWHPCISQDGNWIVTDCQPDQDQGQSDIMLIHVPTGDAQRLLSVYTQGRHPYHPHPSFSLDASQIAVAQRDEKNNELRVLILAVDLSLRL